MRMLQVNYMKKVALFPQQKFLQQEIGNKTTGLMDGTLVIVVSAG